jgi:symplekin
MLTIVAIGICFSMTTVFPATVLATSLNRITDLPTLPVVFLRTTIQAVTTYKSLIPFIANSILPKLVVKKVWENPPLWDGFVRLSKMMAPASFGTLLQLPKEWLMDLLQKQPGIRPAFRGFLEGRGMAAGDIAEVSLIALAKRERAPTLQLFGESTQVAASQ